MTIKIPKAYAGNNSYKEKEFSKSTINRKKALKSSQDTDYVTLLENLAQSIVRSSKNYLIRKIKSLNWISKAAIKITGNFENYAFKELENFSYTREIKNKLLNLDRLQRIVFNKYGIDYSNHLVEELIYMVEDLINDVWLCIEQYFLIIKQEAYYFDFFFIDIENCIVS